MGLNLGRDSGEILSSGLFIENSAKDELAWVPATTFPGGETIIVSEY